MNLNDATTFPIERMEEIIKDPKNFRLIERIPITEHGVLDKLPYVFNKPYEGERCHSIVILDTETTGTDVVNDDIIELGLVKLTFSMERNILISIDRWYDEFEDPKRPIPDEVQSITHITDDMVRGKSLDSDIVGQFMANRPLVVAHNARFDRPLFDRRFPALADMSWACSMSEIKWDMLGYHGAKLEYLLLNAGYFYAAHRAFVDCLAVAWLLYVEPDALDMLINSALSPSYKIFAFNSFDIKDKLKAWGYSYNGTQKCWTISCKSELEAKKQIDLLSSTNYSTQQNVKLVKIGAKSKYKLGH